MSGLGQVGFVIGAVVTVVVLTIYISGGILQSTADFRGQTQEKERVNADGTYRITNYDYFYRTCNSIQAKNEKISLLEEQVRATDDENQKAGYEAGLLAEKQTKAELVAEYNAKVSQQNTAGQYRDAGLPAHIDTDDMEVSCDPAR